MGPELVVPVAWCCFRTAGGAFPPMAFLESGICFCGGILGISSSLDSTSADALASFCCMTLAVLEEMTRLTGGADGGGLSSGLEAVVVALDGAGTSELFRRMTFGGGLTSSGRGGRMKVKRELFDGEGIENVWKRM